MTYRELTIENYKAFMPIFLNLPSDHRYVKEFWQKFFGNQPKTGITDDDRKVLNAKLQLTIQRVKEMPDEQFGKSPCAADLCLIFHEEISGYSKEEYFYGGLRIREKLVDDTEDGVITKTVHRLIDGKWVDMGVLE